MTRAERLLGIINGGDPADDEDVELRQALFRALDEADIEELEVRLAGERPMPSMESIRYRNKAEEIRTIAEGCENRSARDSLKRLAYDYDRLAETAEERAHQKSQTNSGS